MKKKINAARESESLVLGTVINYRGGFDMVSDLIETADVFQEADHRICWNAIALIAREQRQIDMVTVGQQMRLSGGVENPMDMISRLKQLTTVGQGLRGHAMKVVENYIRVSTRSTCQRFGAIDDQALDAADPFEYNEKIIEELTTVLNQITKVSIRDSKSVLHEFMEELTANMKAVAQGVSIVGLPTGLQDMDNILGGFKPQKLYLLAARPAMGKSAYGVCHAPAAISEAATPSGIVSTEMGRVELMGRLIARESGVDSFLIQNGTVDSQSYQKIVDCTHKVEGLPIFIEDHNHSITSLISCIRQMHRRHGCKAVFVDYIQRIMADKTMTKANKNEMVGHFAKSLKSIAKELDIAIIALAQLSREVERRPLKVPQLADLRDSGELEQEADVVIFMYRPSYYKEKYFMQAHQEIWSYGQTISNNIEECVDWLSSLCYFEIAKHRGGKVGRFWCRYDKKTSRFHDISPDAQRRMGGDQGMQPQATAHESGGNFPF